MSATIIPKVLHLIWIGNDTERPDNCIATWVRHHPDWIIKLWGNDDLLTRDWRCAHQMRRLLPLPGQAGGGADLRAVVDLMRWEILADEGGVAVAADSLCLRPLPSHLLARDMFACWENELEAPGVLAAGYVGSVPGNPLLRSLVDELATDENLTRGPARETTGALRLTAAWRRERYNRLSVLPSHSFIPRHHSGAHYRGTPAASGLPDGVYACELWASTLGYADALHGFDTAHMLEVFTGSPAATPLPAPAPPAKTVAPHPFIRDLWTRLRRTGHALHTL